MGVSHPYQGRTRDFARVLGPFFTMVSVVVVVRAQDMRQLLSEFTASDVWPWVIGATAANTAANTGRCFPIRRI